MLIVFCAPVVSLDEAYETKPLPDHVMEDLAGLASTDPDDELVQYLIDEAPNSPLARLPAKEGRLSMTRRGNQLHICATYSLASALTHAQIDALRTYTANQFSDGAGEGWKQQLWNRHQIPLEILWKETFQAPD